ncbi:MAG: hypothetical protein HN472_02495 [Nitrospina sp.]|jgi:type VI secretion system protein|nr:hypothetical protein [Nitrospina sp.]MBT3874662.1 hypothetical protein [Nitrospina sp.]MBT4049396.1 hypothetical protein [Nitrospina sp.]MBT4556309.1 hypothetical protein [Nitrospina sp.]MBT5347134.1 hypothetical protein [Nitrospina sp.]
MKYFLRILFIILILTSCSSIKSTVYFWEKNSFESIKIIAAPNANLNTAIAVDLVFAYDKEMVGELEKINARNWFKGKASYRLNFPTGFDVVSWEVIPGQNAPQKPFPENSKRALGIFIFANYAIPDGVYRARVDKLKYIELLLGEIEINIVNHP